MVPGSRRHVVGVRSIDPNLRQPGERARCDGSTSLRNARPVESDEPVNHAPSHQRRVDVGPIGLLAEDLPDWEQGTVDLDTWFDPEQRGRPLDIEIGSGKGTFLVRAARDEPTTNFIGIEFARAYWRHAADRCRRHGLTNVRLVRAEADFLLRHYVPDGRARHLHIYFPDPWPKARHHKRRLVQPSFLRTVHRVTGPGSLVRIVTDHHDYFQWILEHTQRATDLFTLRPWEPFSPTSDDERAGTNFERKYRKEARPIHALLLARRP